MMTMMMVMMSENYQTAVQCTLSFKRNCLLIYSLTWFAESFCCVMNAGSASSVGNDRVINLPAGDTRQHGRTT